MNYPKPSDNKKQIHLNYGFTLIELLVVISIIVVITGLSLFSIGDIRQNSRDTRRIADLEMIRSGLELYKSDCNSYPLSLPSANSSLVGDPTLSSNCLNTNIYISSIPGDPIGATRSYTYAQLDGGADYRLCAFMEGSDIDSPELVDENCGVCHASAPCTYAISSP